MLNVESVRADKIPGRFCDEVERLRGKKFIRRHPFEKRQRESAFCAIKEKSMPAAHFDGIAALPGKRRNFVARRNAFANTIRAVFPAMQRTNEAVAFDESIGQGRLPRLSFAWLGIRHGWY